MTTKLHRPILDYLFAGRHVRSDLALPGFCELAGTDGEARKVSEIQVMRGTDLAQLTSPKFAGPNWCATAELFQLTVPDICRFQISNGQRLEYEALGNAGDLDVAAFVPTALSILLHQAGAIVLRACVLDVEGKAVVLASQLQGLSSLAVTCMQKGFRPISEGLCALSVTKDRDVIVQPDLRQLQLWPDAARKFGIEGQMAKPVRPSIEKCHLDLPVHPTSSLPLRSLYILQAESSGEAGAIRQANVLDGPEILWSGAFQKQVILGMESKRRYFAAAAALLKSQQLFCVQHVRHASENSVVADTISRHLQGQLQKI